MMHLLQKLLAACAKAILRKYHPKIVAITGSLGKSSAKEAAVAALRERFHVRGNPKSYNNQLGVPLAIIGASAGGRSPLAWFGIFFRAVGLLFGRSQYPAVLVLEMGADHPGDLAYLLNIAPPMVGVVTAVASVHTEFLTDVAGVRKEKGTLVTRVPQDGVVILNADDDLVRGMMTDTRARVVTYGFSQDAEVRAVDFTLRFSHGEGLRQSGTFFKIAYGGAVVPVGLVGVLGKQHVYAALAGAAIGIALGMNLAEIGMGLRGYAAPRGRMRIIPGIKGAVLIDDVYNASPRAVLSALETLRELPVEEPGRRIAVLGDMKELGAYTEEGHRSAGRRAAELGIDLLVTVGELARDIARGAREAGMPDEHVVEFSDRDTAGKFVQDRVKTDDIILVKGSRSMKMEYVVKELMAEPLRAKDLLVWNEK